MNSEDLSREAAEIGLDLNPHELRQLARATALARRLADRLPRDLPLDAEPALVLRLRRRVPQ
jgi:hypothetical protein